jgi:hypothetical protein
MSKILDREILEARRLLWHKGILTWKLDSFQKEVLDLFKKEKSKILVLNCSRRGGKSFFLAVMAIEQCLQTPKSVVKILQPTTKMLKDNLRQVWEQIFEDCPSEIKPKFDRQQNVYEFPNGSIIQLAGIDNKNHEKLRGGNSDLCIVDEAGFCDDLSYAIQSVLLPTTLLTKGKIILASTPPPVETHDFVKYVKSADEKGTLIHKTIYDIMELCRQDEVPRITEDIIDDIIDQYPGGKADPAFRREYMAEIVQDSESSGVPEATKELVDDITTEWPKPIFCDKYVSMDIGLRDLTVILFGYYDYDNGILYIEDEKTLSGKQVTIEAISNAVKRTEEELWTDPLTGEQQQPTMRVADNDLIVINDLQQGYGLTFIPTKKTDKEAHINFLRTQLLHRKIYINPRCKKLLNHLRFAQWDRARSKFKRSIDGHHYDALDALIYMVRNVTWGKNPYPRGYRAVSGPDSFYKPNYQDKSRYDDLAAAILNRRNKK